MDWEVSFHYSEAMTLEVRLKLLKDAAQLSTLFRTLEPLSNAIEDLNTWIVVKGSTHKPEDLVLDGDAQELEEALLGVAFVACQAGMTFVAARARNLAEYCRTNGVVALVGWETKEKIYGLGEEALPGGPSKIFFLNAVANYFKHRDEWEDTEWANLSKKNKPTAQSIAQLGLSRYAKDNLRRATAVLDDAIFEAVKVWAGSLVDQAEKELATHL